MSMYRKRFSILTVKLIHEYDIRSRFHNESTPIKYVWGCCWVARVQMIAPTFFLGKSSNDVGLYDILWQSSTNISTMAKKNESIFYQIRIESNYIIAHTDTQLWKSPEIGYSIEKKFQIVFWNSSKMSSQVHTPHSHTHIRGCTHV